MSSSESYVTAHAWAADSELTPFGSGLGLLAIVLYANRHSTSVLKETLT